MHTALAPEALEATCQALGRRWRDSFWGPAVTLPAFLLQVLSAEKTLRAAVADLLAQRAVLGREPPPSVGGWGWTTMRSPGRGPAGNHA